MSVHVCIYHPVPVLLKAYHQLFDVSSGYDSVGVFMDFQAFCSEISQGRVSLALVSVEHADTQNFQMCKHKIREANPKVKVVMLGVNFTENQLEDVLSLPLRAVIDYAKQSKAEILQCLRHVSTEGHDFNYLKSIFPRHEARIAAYEMSIPNIDDQFWALIPMMATGAKQHELAAYFGVSRQTIINWIEGYKKKLEVQSSNELLVLATAKGWIDDGQIQLARTKLKSKEPLQL